MRKVSHALCGSIIAVLLVLAGCDSTGNTGDPPEVTRTMTWNVTVPGYTSQDMGYRLLRLDPDNGTIVSIPETGAKATGSTGYVQISLSGIRGNHYGITIFKDLDSSGTLTTGDVVWGDGDGVFTYVYYSYTPGTRPLQEDVSFLVEDWTDYLSIPTNTY
jgi:hypothetical protein